MRRKSAGLRDIPGIAVRVIEYTVESEDGTESSETFTLVTDILDPALLSCGQAAAAYASRWQLETCFDELETSIRGGATVVLRSKSPPMIRQEIYAMLCCYQAIRTLISHAAGDSGLDPRRVSFTRARDAVRRRISDPGSFSPSRAGRSARRPGLRDHHRAQPRARAPGPSLRAGDQAARRTVQAPQARPAQPAAAVNEDQILATASASLT